MTTLTTLSPLRFIDMLPESAKNIAEFKAAATCLDKLVEGFDERVKLMLIYSRIDELDNDQLDNLAWQWNIGYFEGYNFAETLADKRILIKQAIQMHWHKGTKWALESVPVFLGMPAFVIEWFDSDILGTHMEPYEFDIAIDTGVRGARPTIQDDIRNLINNLKNVRSYLRHVILMETWHVTAYYAVQGAGIGLGAIRPKDWPGGEVNIGYGYASGGYDTLIGQVNPKPWTEKELKIKHVRGTAAPGIVANTVGPKLARSVDLSWRYGRIVGGYAATVGRVNPKPMGGGDIGLKHRRNVAGPAVIGNSIMPKIQSIEGTVKVNKALGAGSYAATVGTVRPQSSEGEEASVGVKSRTSGYSATVGRVYPKKYYTV